MGVTLPLWIGDRTSGTSIGPFEAGIWVGELGKDLMPVNPGGPAGEGGAAAGPALYYRGPDPGGNGHEQVLWEVTREGAARAISRVAHDFVVATSGHVVLVSRSGPVGRDAGVWAIPLSGGADPYSVIPATPGNQSRVGLAATPDGRLVASGSCRNGDDDLSMDVVVDGAVRDLGVVGIPLGFDDRQRLVFWAACNHARIEAIEPRSGAREVLVPEGQNESRVTPDGKYLVVWFPEEDLAAQEIRVIALASGEMWSRRVDGYWAMTQLGDNEFAVFEGLPDRSQRRLQPMVVSLRDRWLTVLPPVADQP